LKPIMTVAPSVPISAQQVSTIFMSSAMGFSQRIALLARAARVISSTCVSVLVAISTASTSGSARTSSTDCAARTPSSAAIASEAFVKTSKTETSFACGWRARLRACMVPMRPQPRTEKRIMKGSFV
jgi:hypothetical protein